MKVLHLAAGNRWTGAAAPAFAEVEALRQAGIEAHYAYVGGYKLEAKLREHPFAHPVIAKAQNPVAFRRTLAAIRRLLDEHRFDILHAHLTYDHVLARFAARGREVRVARTFHSRRTLRTDPFTRMLLAGTPVICVINGALRDAALLARRNAVVTPPPLDSRLFKPAGENVRALYDLGDAPVVAAIGKLSAGRGFEAVLQTFAAIRRATPAAKLMVIGHGEHRPVLEALTAALGLAEAVVWAGYHEDDLPQHYRAADVLLFTAAGSDEGHRAVMEAMACGVVPAAFPIEGIDTVAGELTPRLVAGAAEPEALAAIAGAILGRRGALREAVLRQAETFTFPHAAARLLRAYEQTVLQTAAGHVTIR